MMLLQHLLLALNIDDLASMMDNLGITYSPTMLHLLMSQPSNWPLPAGSSRVVLPLELTRQLAHHPLTQHLYPLAYGHYLQAYGHTATRQHHNDYLLLFCHQGRGTFQLNHLQQPVHGELSAGQLLLIPQSVAHHYEADKTDPWSLYWLHFQGTSAHAAFSSLALSVTNPTLSIQRWRTLLPLVTDLLNLQHQRFTIAGGVLAATLLQHLMAQLPLLIEPSSAASFSLTALERYMRDNCHRDLQLDDFAAFTGLSRYHFAKKFKVLTGTAPMRYFNQIKINLACQLLDTTTDSIRTIAQAVGFDDPYYFSRLFKKTMGIAPQYYRDSHQQQES